MYPQPLIGAIERESVWRRGDTIFGWRRQPAGAALTGGLRHTPTGNRTQKAIYGLKDQKRLVSTSTKF
ncbi:uncharacterized protein N7482_006691 [Penicillium canariense]|uniref:Uncharacterized protein n=1 Tax=Penicillium canariense TaxID=189055 RepID=A0A9W9HY93_9EURO|nr:uncharacterized protein N7482_006691 [Penicillium canariense]KAJ5159687.1 hypothetical protein N7482_006691 [Penicillium canariense]